MRGGGANVFTHSMEGDIFNTEVPLGVSDITLQYSGLELINSIDALNKYDPC